MPLPMGYDNSLSPFQRLLVLRMLRPDKVVPGIQVRWLGLDRWLKLGEGEGEAG